MSDAKTVKTPFKAALEKSIIERGEAEYSGAKAAAADTEILAKRILLLPIHMQALIYSKYVWHFSPETAEKLFNVDFAKQKLNYTRGLLAYSLLLQKGESISEASLQTAAQTALNSYENAKSESDFIKKPQYSAEFRKQLKDISCAQRRKGAAYLKRASIAFIAAILIFAMTITVNADIRERITNWLVETFSTHSTFTPANVPKLEDEDFENLKKIKLNYIPEGFERTSSFISDEMVVLDYLDENHNSITFIAALITGSSTMMDTEDAEISVVDVHGNAAYTWERDSWRYLVWQKGKSEYNIIAQTSYEEALKIALNIEM